MHVKYVAHLTRMDYDASQKIMCFANRSGQPSHKKRFSKAAGISRHNTAAQNDVQNDWLNIRYEPRSSSSARQNTWRKPNDDNSFSWTDLTLHSLVVFSYLVVVSLYHLQEQSWSVLHRFGKYLQQIPLVIKINQNLQLLQLQREGRHIKFSRTTLTSRRRKQENTELWLNVKRQSLPPPFMVQSLRVRR